MRTGIFEPSIHPEETTGVTTMKFCMDTHDKILIGSTEAFFEIRSQTGARGGPWGWPEGAKIAKKFFSRN